MFGNTERVSQSLNCKPTVEGVGKELGIEKKRSVGVRRLQSDFSTGLCIEQENQQARVIQGLGREVGDEPMNREMGDNLVVWHGLLKEITLFVFREGLKFWRGSELFGKLEPANSQFTGKLCPGAGSMFFPFLSSGIHGGLGAIESLSVCTVIGAGVHHRDEAMIAKP